MDWLNRTWPYENRITRREEVGSTLVTPLVSINGDNRLSCNQSARLLYLIKSQTGLILDLIHNILVLIVIRFTNLFLVILVK